MTMKSDIASVRILPEDVANKIAAGEVVDRPASVVKELVENALDAQATRITVRLVAAGRRLIEVIDNGHGMSEQNALLAIERHATSKVRKASDIEAIMTMGFRGEALPSIGAVSQFELVTRRAKDNHATRIRVDGGILRDVEQTGAPPGTRVSANRLYFNTPVRAKFLKGITTELGHCIDTVQRHALARTGVGFQLLHNDKLLFDVPENATLRERIALIWGMSFVRDLTPFDAERGGFHFHGYIGLPGLTRSGRSHQFFFLNKRPVSNRSIQYGFEDGYRGLVTVGRHPVGVVLLEVHPRMVDVNIHPSKREVRFRDERAVRGIVRDLVRGQLAAMQPEPPVARAEEPAPPPQQDFFVEPARAATRSTPPTVDSGGGAAAQDHAASAPYPVSVEQAVPPDMQRTAPATPEGPSISHAPAGTPEQPAPMAAGIAHEQPRDDEDEVRKAMREFAGDEQPELSVDDVFTVGGQTPEAVYRPLEGSPDAPLQLFDTYLLVPTRDRLLIIDQHALHERVMFEKLLERLERGGGRLESQGLLTPAVVEADPKQVDRLDELTPLFERLGIEAGAMGPRSVGVRAFPTLLLERGVEPGEFIADLLERHEQEGFAPGDESALHEVLDMMACKAAVKAGDRLTDAELDELMSLRERVERSASCPHGRPTTVRLSIDQLEKLFHRR